MRIRLTKPIGYFLAFAVLAGALIMLATVPRYGVALQSDLGLLPYRIETVFSMPVPLLRPLIVADVDLDGNDDLLVNTRDRLLWYRFQGNEMVLAGERVYEYPASTRMVADVAGDERPEFFVLVATPENMSLNCYKWFSPGEVSTPLYTISSLFPPDLRDPLQGLARITIKSFKTAKDTHSTVVVQINNAKSGGPCRNLVACDGATGQELWRFDSGPFFCSLEFDDFGTGVSRVLIATGDLTVGIACQGPADSICHVFCLDGRDGRCLWKKEMTGYLGSSFLALADINGDGKKEILVTRYLAMRDSAIVKSDHPWTIAVMNHEGEILSSVAFHQRVNRLSAVDFEGDSSPEILVESVGRSLFALGPDLTVNREIIPYKPPGAVEFRKFGVCDFTGGGKQEIGGTKRGNLLVTDHNGNVLAGRRVRDIVDLKIVRNDGRNYIIAVTGHLIKNEVRTSRTVGDSIYVLALSRLPVGDRLRAHSRRLTIGAAAAVLLGGWAVFSVRNLLKQRRGKRIDLYEAQSELLTAMSAFGHGGSSLKILDRLRLHLKNWDRIRSDGVTREDLFARLQQTYRETIVPELEHLVMLARRADVPENIWGTLLSQAGIAAGGIDEILASGSEGAARRDEQIAKVLAALDAVDGSIAGIRSHLRSVFCAPVAENLERSIARFRYDHGDEGPSFAFASDSSEGAAVFISPVSFDKIIEALLSNAVRATEGKTGAEIAISAQREGNYCRIDVRDNGCGIPREDWERVFDRHYTTKDEGGFGLYYAREELARFGGKIYVVDSVEGSGTTMRVILRKSEKAGTV